MFINTCYLGRVKYMLFENKSRHTGGIHKSRIRDKVPKNVI